MATLDGRPASADDLLALALTNVGHFTSMRFSEDGSIRGLTLHMERLTRDCKIVWDADLDIARVRSYIRQVLENQQTPCVVRVTIFDPTVDVGHPAEAHDPHILVSARKADTLPPQPMRVRSTVYQRTFPEVKHTGLFGAIYTRGLAQRINFDDVLFIGRDGLVSEGCTWNAGFVDQEGTVVWPQAPALPGVTMELLQQNVEHRVATVTLDQATGMAAAFATNALIGVCSLAAIDDTEFPLKHPVLRQLQEKYLQIPGEAL
ncbi:aminotransferase class IV family protein [Streptomyces sp. NBC_01643]|uniref:aminotransferase class IV family protein n=1 Tax=Streptomyces sp. NBC_01643 TaxID=2975906 RepID=UPI002F9127F3|nr:aminotransferase class IV family protein [Streptomyces sp. NBC_01643]